MPGPSLTKPPLRKLSSHETFRAGKDAIVVTKRHYKKHQRMHTSHYGGQLQGDSDDGNIEFVQGKHGEFSMRRLPEMSQSMPALQKRVGPEEEDDEASQQPFGHRKSKYGAGARDSIASIRQEAKKQGYRRMTLEVKKLRETERKYYDKKKKKSPKHRKKTLQKLVDSSISRNIRETSFAAIAKRTILAESNVFDDFSEDPNDDDTYDDNSLGDSSYASGDASMGSLGEFSIASGVSVMGPIHITTDVTIAKAMARFNKRKAAYERKLTLTENSRATLMKKVHEKKMKPIRARKARRETEALKKMINMVKLVHLCKVLQFKIALGKKSKEQREKENATATYLQNTLARAKSRKMWKKYTEFYSKVFRSRWIFQMAIRTWRRKRGTAVIKNFLEDNKDRSPMNLMITKFMTKVRRVQRFAKSFLICHNLRIKMLGEIWDEVEDKFAKRLEGRMKDARRMKPIVIPPTSDIDQALVKAYNSTCDLWSIMDKKMDTLLQSEREKKHLSNNKMAAMHLEKLSRTDKRHALCDVLKQARALHIANITELENRIMEDKKKKARVKFTSAEASKVLNLKNRKGEVKKPKPEPRVDFKRNIPLFMFWSSFGGLEDLKKHVEEIYHKTYREKHGDPIKKWKEKMAAEAVRRERNKSRGRADGGKGGNRRYGLSVEQFQGKFDLGIETSAVGGDSSGQMSQERTVEAMVSAIRNKQRKKEVENLKARSAVQTERQRRHRKAGLNSGNKEDEELALALKLKKYS
ncbi:hypothetical protein TrLO_g15680 [Triparma laevis f. longispina]|uniref:Uncharacterized protein n=1 Tax=Triparma laevis f. longispina TaxID=1714387 RepID=A0A9W7L160_9STRA|nr:hypothetical protein TrLO_g15680 [Triparma laevis f. longispina]